jgi:CHAT domain-containing protein/tetratricopeptide (TPR) repeat protein
MLGYTAQRESPMTALEIYQQALVKRREAGDKAGEAVTLKNIAEHHRLASRFAPAWEAMELSLQAWRASGDRAGEAGMLSGMSTLAMMQGDYPRALDLLRGALAIQEQMEDIDGQARSLSNMSTAYRSLGDLGEALAVAERSLPLRKQVKDERGEAYTLANLGDTWKALGEPERALEYYTQALEKFRKVKDPTGLGGLYVQIAQTHFALGRDEEGLSLLEETVTVSRAAGVPRLEGRALALAGGMLAARHEHPEALVHYEAALQVMARAADPTYESMCRAGACRSLVALGRLEEAGPFCTAATSSVALVVPSLASSALIAQADLARAQGRWREAASDLDLAFRRTEALRDRIPLRERASYLSDRQEPYRFWLDVLSELDRTNPSEGWDRRAFHASERLKARALLEEVVEARGDIAAALDPKLGERRREIEASLGGLQRQLYDPKLPEQERGRLEAQLAEREADYERLVREVSRRAAAGAALRYPEPAEALAVAAALPREGALIAYALGKERAIAFVVTRERFRAVSLPADPRELDRLVRNTTELLSRDEGGNARMAARLGRELLAPLASEIPAAVRSLIVVPDGPLHALPFEALPGIRGSSTLLEEFAISYAPSATLSVALRSDRPSASPATLLALANPETAADAAGSARLLRFYEGEGLRAGALPHAGREAQALRQWAGIGSEVYVGDDATETRAKQKLPSFGVLHFATHGLVSERYPARSALRLAAQGGEDGFLQAREIANMRVVAEMVVLSGCRTARGRLLAGEGPQSLARAFFQAGASSVVASLWDVGDEATANLMQRFYAGLAAGRPRGDALRDAKLGLRREGRPSSEWAAFVLLGEAERGVALNPPPSGKGVLPAMILIAAGALAILATRRRK